MRLDMDLYRICYASEFIPIKYDAFHELTEISFQSRHFTFKHNITGILCFVDGQLFECLEGTYEALKGLMDRIELDSRHQNIVRIEMKQISGRKFSEWNIQYISKRSQMHTYCQRIGLHKFMPYQVELQHIDAILEQLSLIDMTL